VLPRRLGCRPGRGRWHLVPDRTALTRVYPSRLRHGSRSFVVLLIEEERLPEADAIPGREQVGHMPSQALLVEEGPRAAAQVDEAVAASPTQAGRADLGVIGCDAGSRDDQVVIRSPSHGQDGWSQGDGA
jgi:hypothetical protein